MILTGAKLLALSSPSKIEAGKDLPDRILLVPWGTTQTNQGVVICNATTLSQLPANQAAVKRDRVAIDFQHSTVEGSKWYKGEPAKVAAFASLEVIEGQGIFLTDIEWTAEGKEFAAGGHYPDLSPALVTNPDGEVILIHSAGLVRQGELDGITLFSAEALQLISTNTAKEDPMKDILIKLLGLPADSTEAQIQTAAAAFQAKTTSFDPDIKALAARIKSIEDNQAIILAAGEQSERDNLVRTATAQGKVIPLSAEDIKATPVKILSAMIEKLPVTVPLDQRTGTVREFSAHTTEAPVADEVRSVLGISKDTWAKHNKAA